MQSITLKSRLLVTAAATLSVPLTCFGALEHEFVQPIPAHTGKVDASEPYKFLDIPVFNTELGTLVKIEFRLQLDSQPFVEIRNHDKKAELYSKASATDQGSLRLDLPTETGTRYLGISTGPESTRGKPPGPAASGLLTPKGTADDFAKIFGPVSWQDKDTTIFDPTGMYSGTAGETYNLMANFVVDPANVTGRGNTGVFFSGGDDLWACLSVEYFYCNIGLDPAIPEPSTWALMIVSVGALVLGRRFLVKRPSLS